MNKYYYLQNAVLLASAVGLAVFFDSGWPFLLMLFWVYESEPKTKDPLDKLDLPLVNFEPFKQEKDKQC